MRSGRGINLNFAILRKKMFLTWINQKSNSLDRGLHFIGYPDAGRGDLAGLPVSFQNVKKP